MLADWLRQRWLGILPQLPDSPRLPDDMTRAADLKPLRDRADAARRRAEEILVKLNEDTGVSHVRHPLA